MLERGHLLRTTLTIDDDVLSAAKELATIQGKSLGEIISTLSRTALRPANSLHKTRNGIPLLPENPKASRVTSQLVRQLLEELP